MTFRQTLFDMAVFLAFDWVARDKESYVIDLALTIHCHFKDCIFF